MASILNYTVAHAYTDSELKQLGDRYLTKFDYERTRGYQVRLEKGEISRFFSVAKCGSMRAAKQAAKAYRDELLRAGAARTQAPGYSRASSAVVRPCIEAGDPRLRAILSGLELLYANGIETLSYAALFLLVATEPGIDGPTMRERVPLAKNTVTIALRWLCGLGSSNVGRCCPALLQREKLGWNQGYAFKPTKDGESLVRALICLPRTKRGNTKASRTTVTFRNDPQLQGLQSAVEQGLRVGLHSVSQLMGFVRAALYEGSSVAAITGKGSQHPESVALVAIFRTLSRKSHEVSGRPAARLLLYPDTRAEDGHTKTIKLSSRGRKLLARILLV